MKKTFDELKPLAFFDAVGGELTDKVLSIMPKLARVYIYGFLSGVPNVSVKAYDITFEAKQIRGFMAFQTYYSATEEEIDNYFKVIKDDLVSGGKIFGTTLVKEYSLDEWETAYKEGEKYSNEGKAAFKPNN